MKPGCTISFDGLGLLTVVLVVLKATGYIGWSWWLVFAPIWLPMAIGIGFLVVWFVLYVWTNSGRRWP